MINIDTYISSLENDGNLVEIDGINPNSHEIYKQLFIYKKAVKYKKTISINTSDINYNERTKKYYYKFNVSRTNTDIITNISCNNLILLLLSEEIINCNIHNIILPIVNMPFTPIDFYINISNYIPNKNYKINISYDVYVLDNITRKKIMNAYITNKLGMKFNNGCFDFEEYIQKGLLEEESLEWTIV